MAAEGIERHALTVLVGLAVTGLVGGTYKLLRHIVGWFRWVDKTVKADHEAIGKLETVADRVEQTAICTLSEMERRFAKRDERLEHRLEEMVRATHERIDDLFKLMTQRAE